MKAGDLIEQAFQKKVYAGNIIPDRNNSTFVYGVSFSFDVRD
jgi:hypothetical protein